VTDGAERSAGIGGSSPAPPPMPPPPPDGNCGPGTLVAGGTSGTTRCANAPVVTTANTETPSAATGRCQRPRLIEQSKILGT
jgi:hypothetical protein